MLEILSPVPRGIRNNNPLNIRRGSKWRGLCKIQTDKSFCQFISMYYGLRASCFLLLRYYKEYHLLTLNDIISRWAPSSENDTQLYISQVVKILRLRFPDFSSDKDLHLDTDDDLFFCLLCAMAYVENGVNVHLSPDDFFEIVYHDLPHKFLR